jgi:hypothetical protein
MNKAGYFLTLFFRQCSAKYDKTITAASINIRGSLIIFIIVSMNTISAITAAGFNLWAGKKRKIL